MSFISPLFLYLCTAEHILNKVSLWELLGLRLKGIVCATIIPLLLTMVLFMGPLSMQAYSGIWKLYAEPVYWWSNIRNVIWLRSHVVAPLSEEFTFRACMLPLLLPCFRPMTAIFIGPLFFGVAHFHHMIERIKTGIDFKTALLVSCFQFSYTTIFGAYAAYLFLKTGHFIAPFIAHAFCNHMGFPDFTELNSYKPKQRAIVISLFIVGLLSWCYLLTPLTNPVIYSNDIYTKLVNC
ncbi:CAAX prenyl protease 2 isoform X2 [Chrysoperla carnea]|nr:CAAX prenyl protease 2 isoform X2 [Chrysoperla carnea]